MRVFFIWKRVLLCSGFVFSLCLLQAQNKEMYQVAENDCGVEDVQTFLVKGESFL